MPDLFPQQSNMAMGGLSLLSGILQGVAQKKQFEMGKPQRELQKQLLQIQLQNAKNKQQESAFRQSIIDRIFTQQDQQQTETAPDDFTGPAEPSTRFGDSFQEQSAGGLLDQLTAPQQAALKQMTGIDLLGAGRLQQQQEANRRLEEQGQERLRIAQEGLDVKRETITQKPVTIGGVPHLQGFNFRGEKVGPPVPIGGKKALPGELGAKLELARTGLQDIKDVKSQLVKDGKIDRQLLFEMNSKLPFSKGRNVAAQMNNALETKIRLESGAAVPPEEIARLAQRFKPSLLDNDAGVIGKLDRMTDFLNGVVSVFDPNKIYAPGSDTFTDDSGQTWVVEPKTSKSTKPKTAEEYLKSLSR